MIECGLIHGTKEKLRCSKEYHTEFIPLRKQLNHFRIDFLSGFSILLPRNWRLNLRWEQVSFADCNIYPLSTKCALYILLISQSTYLSLCMYSTIYRAIAICPYICFSLIYLFSFIHALSAYISIYICYSSFLSIYFYHLCPYDRSPACNWLTVRELSHMKFYSLYLSVFCELFSAYFGSLSLMLKECDWKNGFSSEYTIWRGK